MPLLLPVLKKPHCIKSCTDVGKRVWVIWRGREMGEKKNRQDSLFFYIKNMLAKHLSPVGLTHLLSLRYVIASVVPRNSQSRT